jgi:hypothetical protein
MPYKLQVFAKGKQVQSYAVSSGDITDILIDQTMSLAPSASHLLYSVQTPAAICTFEHMMMLLLQIQTFFMTKR